MSTAIKVENIGKKYIIQHNKNESYETLRDSLVTGGKNLLSKIIHPSQTKKETLEEFWALQDINFEIKQGDKVGIIGRNGAGKSTLLKVLSRITEPTTGKIHINGRIASLLEVGTGFHPELTGRENIFLNGAILGMSRKEIKSKFDEIVYFSEVEKFLDTPVKRYSSGMYVRLAFSVAAHLEPEILVVDEVLAVGDLEFQKKCLGKMGDVSKEGRTILFVSHNMATIQQLCSKSILLENGKINYLGKTSKAVEIYSQKSLTQSTMTKDLHLLDRKNNMGEDIIIQSLSVRNEDKECNDFNIGEKIFITITCMSHKNMRNINFVIGIDSLTDERILTSISPDSKMFTIKKGGVKSGTLVIKDILTEGTYRITIAIRSGNNKLHDYLNQISIINIKNSKSGEFIDKPYLPYGYINIRNPSWTIK